MRKPRLQLSQVTAARSPHTETPQTSNLLDSKPPVLIYAFSLIWKVCEACRALSALLWDCLAMA